MLAMSVQKKKRKCFQVYSYRYIQAGYPGFARGRTLPLFRVNKLINILKISIKLKLRVKSVCFLRIKEACRYTLRYTYENSMVMNNYLLDNSNGENVKVL